MIFWNLELWHGIKVSICIKNVKYFSHKLWLIQHIFHLIRLHIFKRQAESAAVVSFPDLHSTSTFQVESSRYLVSTLLSISTILNHGFAPVTQKNRNTTKGQACSLIQTCVIQHFSVNKMKNRKGNRTVPTTRKRRE